jgi:hypothetical protein
MGTPTNTTAVMVCSCHEPKFSGSCAGQTRNISTNDNAKIERLTAHTDHATQAVAGVLMPPAPKSCSFASSVTTPLYRTAPCLTSHNDNNTVVSREAEVTDKATVCRFLHHSWIPLDHPLSPRSSWFSRAGVPTWASRAAPRPAINKHTVIASNSASGTFHAPVASRRRPKRKGPAAESR